MTPKLLPFTAPAVRHPRLDLETSDRTGGRWRIAGKIGFAVAAVTLAVAGLVVSTADRAALKELGAASAFHSAMPLKLMSAKVPDEALAGAAGPVTWCVDEDAVYRSCAAGIGRAE